MDSLTLTFSDPQQLMLSSDLQLLIAQPGTIAVTSPAGGEVTWSGSGATFGATNETPTTVRYAATGQYEITANWTDGDTMLTGTIQVSVVNALQTAQMLLLGTNSGTDRELITFLESRGHAVDVQPPETTSGSLDLSAYDALLLSSSMDSTNLDESWRDVELPMLIWEAFALPDLGMGIDPAASDLGGTSYPYLHLLSDHPLNAGYIGTIRLSGVGRTLYATPAPSAILLGEAVPSLAGTALGVTYFAYEPGEMLPGYTTESRRVFLPLGLTLADGLTADGKDLVETALAWALEAGTSRRTRVMALGDSITRGTNTGSNITYSYRDPLTLDLDMAECSYDMVGTLQSNVSGDPDRLFDWDHEGHGGFTTTQIRGNLTNYLEGNIPDIVLIHLGTNDLLQGLSEATSEANLENIVANLRGKNASVTILLAQIIPADYQEGTGQQAAVENLAANVPSYNTMLAEFAAGQTSDASRIILVDLNTDFPIDQLDPDGIHPTATAEEFMAERWYGQLAPLLSCQNP